MQKKITLLKVITIFVVAILSVLILNYNDTLRVPSIFDGKIYNTHFIKKADNPYSLIENPKALPDMKYWADSETVSTYLYPDILFQNSNTTAFLILKNDTLIFKRYLNGVKEGENTQLFSVTKVLVTALLGSVIKDGYIKSLDESVTNYFPNLKDTLFKQLTLRHLVQMESGLNYDEYGSLYQTLSFYYEKNLSKNIYNAKFVQKPGKQFKYKSIDTQILGECIRNALKKKNINFFDYFHESYWNKLGMQDTAYWSLDSKITRNPKFYGGLNMSARDLAKFAIMVQHEGKFNKQQLVPKNWFNYCDDTLHRCIEDDKYCLGWYYSVDDTINDVYFGAGFNGQILMINERTNVIVIRLGTDRGGVKWYDIMKKLTELV
jgi:CubicO group peptidase (beta-lactamase class C family)